MTLLHTPYIMMISSRIGLAGLLVLAVSFVSACNNSSDSPDTTPVQDLDGTTDPTDDGTFGSGGGSSSDSDTPVIVDSSGDINSGDETPADDAPVDTGTGSGSDSDSNSGTDTNPDTGTVSGNDTDAGTNSGSSGNSQEPVATDNLPAATVSGADTTHSENDSPTHAETASLVGPFIKDPSRGAGPPSAPQNLTLLLSAEEWIEFTWEPSTDDQSVEAYEVYRDGALVASVRGDSGYEHDYRNWLSTSFIDCNYTRFTYCEHNQPVPGSSYSYTVVAVDNEGMRSAHSAAAVFAFAQSQSQGVDLSSYTKVFSEEFNGSTLDRARWKTSLPWGEYETINGELQHYVNIFGNNPPAYDPFVFTGDTLQITSIETPDNMYSQAANKPYLSGVLTTSDHFQMTYGYVELKAKVAGGQGVLSTFYLFNQDWEKNKPEIDVLEYIGARPDKAYQTYHYYDSNRARYFSGEKHSSPTMETVMAQNLSDDFHTYGVLWEEGLVIWYLDGQEVRRLTGTRVSDEPMNIIAQLVVGSDWIGHPAEGVIPAVFEIDYIRAFQKQ